MKKRFIVSGCIAALFLIICSGCVSRAFYYPDSKVYQLPTNSGLKYEDVTFRSSDNTKLHGWFVPAVGKAKGTVIHFHGNAQNLTAHFSFVDWLPRKGFNLFIFDYRGYGRSEGSPGRRGLYKDSVSAIKYIKSRKDIDQEKIFVLGQSLGGANAIAAVGGSDSEGIKAVAIDSAFYSYRSIVREKMRAIPVISLIRWPLSYCIITDSYSPSKYIDDIAPTPLLLFHGSRDRVISGENAVKLYKKAGNPKECTIIDGGGHTSAFRQRYGDKYRNQLVKFYMDSLDQGQSGKKKELARISSL